MNHEDFPILVSSSDHGYEKAYIRTTNVVYNTKTRRYSEYVGDEYLEENEIVIKARVVE